MERPTPPLDAERLLAESGWVRHLVRALVHDPSLAEDVVQDAWVTALERPPLGKAGAVWRAWIARVARSRVRQHRIGEQRRLDRERQVVDPTASAPSAYEVVARTQLLQRVVAAVLELDEPHRSAVLWHFYDDLPAREIARRQGIREENARQRVARGLARLRARLDGEHGGDGRSWAVALAPLCSSEVGAGATGSLVAGTLIMGKTIPVALGLAAAAAGLLFLGPWRAKASAPPMEWVEPGEPAPLVVGSAPLPREPEAPREAPASARTSATVERTPPDAPSASRWTVRARIVDPEGVAVAGATLEVAGAGAPVPSGSRGDVELRLEDELPTIEADGQRYVRTLARAPGHASSERIELAPAVAGVIELGEVRLYPIGTLGGLVLDRAGRTVPGAEVCLARPALGASGAADRALLGPDYFTVVQRTESDAAGRFGFEDVESGSWRAWAGASESRWSTSDVLRLERGVPWPEVVLVLDPLAASEGLRGLVLASDSQPLPGASIQVALEGGEYSMSALSGEDGRFAVAVPAGLALVVTVVDPGERHRPETRTGVVGSAAELVFALREVRRVEVSVHDERGDRVTEPLLRVDLVAPDRQEFYRPDADGLVRVPLPERPFALVARAEGHATVTLAALDPETMPAELALELRRLARVTGRVLAGGKPVEGAIAQLVRLARPGAVDFIDGFPARLDGTELQGERVGADGRFALCITTRGSFALYAEHPGFAAAEIGPLELDPERPETLDIELGVGGAVAGRVLVPTGESAAGVLVRASRGDMRVHEAVTDAEGRYRLEHLAPGPYMVQATRERRGQDLAFSATAIESVDGEETSVFPWAFSVTAGETTRYDIDLLRQSRGAIEGSVRVDGGAPAGAARLVPLERPWMERSFETREVELGADGSFAFRSVRPGRYRIVVAFHAGALAGSELVRDLEVGPEPSRCDLQVSTARASGSVPAGWSGPFALLATPAPELLCVTPLVPGDGRFDEVALAAGSARLAGWREGAERTDPTSWATCVAFDAPAGALARVAP